MKRPEALKNVALAEQLPSWNINDNEMIKWNGYELHKILQL